MIFIENTTTDRLEMPFWLKMNLTIKEASVYSNIGINTIRDLLKEKSCPFLLKVKNKQLVKRAEFEKYLEEKHYI